MKILLDHNTPHQLRGLLSDHEVHTAAYLGWSEFENGELLEAAASYVTLITCDQGISNDRTSAGTTSLITIMSGDWTVIRENIGLIRPALETAVRGEPNQVTNDARGLSHRLTKESPGGRD